MIDTVDVYELNFYSAEEHLLRAELTGSPPIGVRIAAPAVARVDAMLQPCLTESFKHLLWHLFLPHMDKYHLFLPHLGKYRCSSSCKGRCHIAAWLDWEGKGEAVRGNSLAVLPRRRAAQSKVRILIQNVESKYEKY